MKRCLSTKEHQARICRCALGREARRHEGVLGTPSHPEIGVRVMDGGLKLKVEFSEKPPPVPLAVLKALPSQPTGCCLFVCVHSLDGEDVFCIAALTRLVPLLPRKRMRLSVSHTCANDDGSMLWRVTLVRLRKQPSERAVSWCPLRHTSASKSGHRLGHRMATRIYPYASAAVSAPQAPASGAARLPARAGTGLQSFLVW
jgi:hypothetical protein